MAGRSTRNKIRHQADQVLVDVDKILTDLRYIDALADGRSEYVNENLPVLVLFLEEFIKTCTRFRQGL